MKYTQEPTPQELSRDYFRHMSNETFALFTQAIRAALGDTQRITHFEAEAIIETLTGIRPGWKS
jgi:hypothetical protein